MSAGALLLATMATGTAMGAGSQYAQGKQVEAWHKYNVGQGVQKDKQALEAGRYEQLQHQKKAAVYKAGQRAGYAAKGFLPQGTVLTVAADTAAELELDAQMIAYGAQTESRGWQNMALLEKAKGESASRAGKWGAATTLMQGASQMGQMYYQYGGGAGGSGKASTPMTTADYLKQDVGLTIPRKETTADYLEWDLGLKLWG